MVSSGQQEEPDRQSVSQFATTHWSLVLAAGEREDSGSQQALAELCQAYWYPVYAYVRRRVSDVHEAQDLTQEFFARLLEKDSIGLADPSRGRFRAFLLTACKRFLVNQWHKARAAKRGGGQIPLSLDFESGESKYVVEAVDSLTAERLYERQWALALLARVMERLREEFVNKNKVLHFEQLKQFISGSKGTEAYGAAADALGISEGAVKVAAHRLRARYRDLLRYEIAQTVEEPKEVDDEIRSLFEVLGG
ncbi:MAG: RNA polymerase subunit sigma-24 [Planctomycetaceae bacterium]|nr:RNA polymerase subunit sigma-24 [Planctomycetaceae bacterium]